MTMDGPSSQSDRRRSQRVPLSLALSLASDHPTLRFKGPCWGVDCSTTGVRIYATWMLPPGTRVRLRTGGVDIAAGHVVRTKSLDTGGWHLGVQFLHAIAHSAPPPR